MEVAEAYYRAVHEEENEAFRTIGYTIGGMMVFPGNRIGGKQTINGARGFNTKIADRLDLTLECIRRHYLGQRNPLGETLLRYRDFFALFDDFGGYVEFFMLQDLVAADRSAVRFFMPFDDFSSRAVPTDGDSYREYRRLGIEFIEARNRRIGLHAEALPLRGDPSTGDQSRNHSAVSGMVSDTLSNLILS